MSVYMLSWARQQKVGDPGAKLVLMLLADNANDEGWCFPSLERLADDCEMHRTTIIRKIDHLVDNKLVERVRQGKKLVNRYRLKVAEGQTLNLPQVKSQSATSPDPQPVSSEVAQLCDSNRHAVPFLTERAASADEDTPTASNADSNGSGNSKPPARGRRKEKAPKADGELAEVRAEAFRLYRAIAGAFRDVRGGGIFGDQLDALLAKGFTAEEIHGGTKLLARLPNPFPGWLRREVLRYREEGPACIYDGYRRGLTPAQLRECPCRLCPDYANFYERDGVAA